MCSIRVVGQGRVIKNRKLGEVFELRYRVQCLDGIRTVTLRFKGLLKPGIAKNRDASQPYPSMASPCWVQCTCPFHKYYVEYALTQPGNSEIKYCNGNPPVIRNPSEIPYVCKHVVLATQKAVKDYTALANKPKKIPNPPKPEAVKEVKKKPPQQKRPRPVPVPDRDEDAYSDSSIEGLEDELEQFEERPRGGPKAPKAPKGPKPLARSPLARDRK